MSQLQRNLVANLVGKGWAAIMGILFIPLFIKFMGIESYGLVGFFTMLQAVFVVMDFGITTTINREIARYSALPEKSQDMRDLVRTLEIVYWGLAICIGALILLLSPFIAERWVKADTLSVDVVERAVALMGVVLTFQWPLGFYAGGLLGLQRQVLGNVLNMIWYTLRFAGGVLVLWLISPTILAFFEWQVIVSIVSTALMGLALWQSLPAGRTRARFRVNLWRSVWQFALGMSGISAITLLLTQLDKIILSNMLSLELFGYYTLAWTVANSITIVTGSVYTVMFPVFSRQVAVLDIAGLRRLYHRSCQLMSVLILPAALLGALFAPEILLIWTQNETMVVNTHLLVSILITGTALNGLMHLPYALQLSHGWTSLSFYANVIAVIVLVPLLILATRYYGALGAAAVWIVLNSGYVLFSVQIMHRRLLIGEQRRWYFEDVGLPLATALGVIGIGRLLIQNVMSLPIVILGLIMLYACALTGAILAAPQMRNLLLGRIGNWAQALFRKAGTLI